MSISTIIITISAIVAAIIYGILAMKLGSEPPRDKI